MALHAVLFEDHSCIRFRPLAWSLPCHELRCGIFNLRERVELAAGVESGSLLFRQYLHSGQKAAGWRIGMDPGEPGPTSRHLWLNGRLAPDHVLLNALQTAAGSAPDFYLCDEDGVLVALLSDQRSNTLARDWAGWERKCAEAGYWRDENSEPPSWDPLAHSEGMAVQTFPGGLRLVVEANDSGSGGGGSQSWLSDILARPAIGLNWIWEIVPATSAAIVADLAAVAPGVAYTRQPFGIEPRDREVGWLQPSTLNNAVGAPCLEPRAQVAVSDPGQLFLGQGVEIEPQVVIDTSAGPVILDRQVRVMAHSRLEGPLYIGPASLVKAGSRIYGESSFGLVNRLAGEIGESCFGDFSNKQHDGFVGHAVLGSWINLGAMTTCSDLKNNYGNVRVDLGTGSVDTGLRFVGLLMGDHAKTAIGTLFNTGTCIGFASNIFGTAMPPKFVGNLRWGGQPGCPDYEARRALATAGTVLGRRGCQPDGHLDEVFQSLARA